LRAEGRVDAVLFKDGEVLVPRGFLEMTDRKQMLASASSSGSELGGRKPAGSQGSKKESKQPLLPGSHPSEEQKRQ